jgi:hypothetical protein
LVVGLAGTVTLSVEHEGAVQAIAFSPDGTRLASGGWGSDALGAPWSSTTVRADGMDPHALLRGRHPVDGRRRRRGERLPGRLPTLGPEPSAAGTVLDGRLLAAVDRLPPGNSLVELLREMMGDLDAGSPVRLHGWRRAPQAPLGVALVLTDPVGTAGHAVLAVTPGGPVFDVVVTPGANLAVPPRTTGPWTVQAVVAAPDGWDAAFVPGLPPPPPGGTATITLQRTGRLTAGLADGPGISVNGITITVVATPTVTPSVDLELRELTAAILPDALAKLLGVDGSGPMAGGSGSATVTARADRDGSHRPAAAGERAGCADPGRRPGADRGRPRATARPVGIARRQPARAATARLIGLRRLRPARCAVPGDPAGHRPGRAA